MCACGHVSLGVRMCARVWAPVSVWHCGYISGHECVQVGVRVCSEARLWVRPGLRRTPMRASVRPRVCPSSGVTDRLWVLATWTALALSVVSRCPHRVDVCLSPSEPQGAHRRPCWDASTGEGASPGALEGPLQEEAATPGQAGTEADVARLTAPPGLLPSPPTAGGSRAGAGAGPPDTQPAGLPPWPPRPLSELRGPGSRNTLPSRRRGLSLSGPICAGPVVPTSFSSALPPHPSLWPARWPALDILSGRCPVDGIYQQSLQAWRQVRASSLRKLLSHPGPDCTGLACGLASETLACSSGEPRTEPLAYHLSASASSRALSPQAYSPPMASDTPVPCPLPTMGPVIHSPPHP